MASVCAFAIGLAFALSPQELANLHYFLGSQLLRDLNALCPFALDNFRSMNHNDSFDMEQIFLGSTEVAMVQSLCLPSRT